MPKLNHSDLLKFWSDACYLREVAMRVGNISAVHSKYRLREEAKSSQKVAHPESRALHLRGKLRQAGTSGFSVPNSPLFTSSPQHVNDVNKVLVPSTADMKIRMKFRSGFKKGEESSTRRIAGFLNEKVDEKRRNPYRRTSEANSTSVFSSVHAVMGKPIARKKLVIGRFFGKSSSDRHSMVSEPEKLHLFEALLRHPKAYAELKAVFHVSRQNVDTLIRKGLLAEVWGPGEIGVRFKLTRKGKECLDMLHKAANFQVQRSGNEFSFV